MQFSIASKLLQLCQNCAKSASVWSGCAKSVAVFVGLPIELRKRFAHHHELRVLRKKHPLSDLRPLFMLQSFPVCIHGADQQGRRWRQLADHKEFCDLRFLALESLLRVLEFLDLGWNVGGLYCNEPPTL
jgi:hypothetical protein